MLATFYRARGLQRLNFIGSYSKIRTMATTTTTMSVNKSSLAGPSRTSFNATIPSMINAIRIREGSEAIDFSPQKRPKLGPHNNVRTTPRFKAPPTIKPRTKSAKSKSKARKPLTLTHKATEGFLPVSLLDEEFIDEGLMAYVVPKDPDLREEEPENPSASFFSSMARTQGRPSKSKAKAKSKRAASPIITMAEPEEAIAAILNQQTVFGTSSQLVASAHKLSSSQESSDLDFGSSLTLRYRNPRRTAPSILDRFKATRSLWSEASRQEDGTTLEAEPSPTRDVSPVKTIELDGAEQAEHPAESRSRVFNVDVLDTPALPRSLVDAALSIRKTPGVKKASKSPTKRKTPVTKEKSKKRIKKASDPQDTGPSNTRPLDLDDSRLAPEADGFVDIDSIPHLPRPEIISVASPEKKKRGRPPKIATMVNVVPEISALDMSFERQTVNLQNPDIVPSDAADFVDLEDIPDRQPEPTPAKKKRGRPSKSKKLVDAVPDQFADNLLENQDQRPQDLDTRLTDAGDTTVPAGPTDKQSEQPAVVPEKKRRVRKPKSAVPNDHPPVLPDVLNKKESMPEYTKQTVSELTKLIKANGFKAIKGKAAMVALLEQCWASTHPTDEDRDHPEQHGEPSTTRFEHFAFAPHVEDQSDGNANIISLSSVAASLRRPSTASSVANSTSTSASEISVGPAPLKKPTSKAKLREVPLDTDDTGPYYRAITRAVKDQPDDHTFENMTWWTRMLLYEPMPIEDLTDWLNEEGLAPVKPEVDASGTERKITEVWYGLVKGWCEAKGIICVWKDGSRPNRKVRTKKSKKKTKTTTKGKGRAQTPLVQEAVEEEDE